MAKYETNWHGTDVNKATSLFENGLLMRWKTKQKSWQCIYHNGINRYSYGWIEDTTFDEIFLKEWGVKHRDSFLKFCGCSWEEWAALSQCQRASEFISYFGNDELFSTDATGGYSAKEICGKIKIKYRSEYGEA